MSEDDSRRTDSDIPGEKRRSWLDRISSAHDFYRTLPEGSRDQIAAVARLGVTMFVESVEDPSTPLAHAGLPSSFKSVDTP